MITIVINDSPYGNERPYNALRLAMALVKQGEMDLRIFLMGDAVVCGLAGQNTPQGYYNIERMLKGLFHRTTILACATCMDARGIKEEDFTEGVKRGSTTPQLAEWVAASEKVLVF
ncbi:MAG: DsrE family protein [Dehalococcoidia bacterium]